MSDLDLSSVNRFGKSIRDLPNRATIFVHDGGRWKVWLGRILFILLVIGLVAVLLWRGGYFRLFLSPEAVIKQYITSLYAQDYPTAYTLLSSVDKGYKSEADYVREKNAFDGFTLTALGRLAAYIEYRSFQVEETAGKAAVTVSMELPDSNDPAIRDILFAAPRSQELPKDEQERLLNELEQLYESGQLPTYTTEQQFDLVKEGFGWAVVENYAAAVRVVFSSEVKYDLPWQVEPLQEAVLTRPGETLTAVYRVKNLSDQPVTAKARHLDSPAAYINDVNIIQCFCLIQQTLRPGEEVDMPLTFRVNEDAPPEMKEFSILYEFYPVEDFPDTGSQ